MSASIPTLEPREITQARTVKWTRDLSDYPPADGWQLSYSIVYGTTTKALAWGTHVTQSGSGYAITLPASLITDLTAGVNARLNGVVSFSGEVFEVYDGALRIKVVGELSQNRQMLVAIQAALLGNASSVENELELSGGGVNQRISNCSKDELTRWEQVYLNRVAAEEARENVAAGRGSGSVIRRRYTLPS